eukprot:254085-Pyramimonas_sp.AAC.1
MPHALENKTGVGPETGNGEGLPQAHEKRPKLARVNVEMTSWKPPRHHRALHLRHGQARIVMERDDGPA